MTSKKGLIEINFDKFKQLSFPIVKNEYTPYDELRFDVEKKRLQIQKKNGKYTFLSHFYDYENILIDNIINSFINYFTINGFNKSIGSHNIDVNCIFNFFNSNEFIRSDYTIKYRTISPYLSIYICTDISYQERHDFKKCISICFNKSIFFNNNGIDVVSIFIEL